MRLMRGSLSPTCGKEEKLEGGTGYVLKLIFDSYAFDNLPVVQASINKKFLPALERSADDHGVPER